jgi:L-alanine-DL-glutamate epimerase-like enolase superfamily enzyme
MRVERVDLTTLFGETTTGQRQPVFGVMRIRTDEGATGIGRFYAGHRPLVEETLSPLLIGENPLNTERLWEKMYAVAGTGGRDARATVGALGALDIALWDLKGKILGCPLHRLLGGFRDDIPVYADGGMFARGPRGHAEWSARQVGDGFEAVKYHVMGEDPDQIVETVRQIRQVVGPHVRLMVDVHKLWDPWVGVATARRLEQYDVYWIEEPIRWDDQVEGMAILAAGTRIMIAAGESEYTLYAGRDLVERAGIKVLQTDILSAGGYTAWLRMAAVAQAHHVKVAPHGASFPELTAPLQAGLPNGLIVSAFPPGEPIEIWSRLYREPIALKDGLITLSDRPGLGLELDDEFIRSRKVD